MEGKMRDGDVFVRRADDSHDITNWEIMEPQEFVESGLLEKVNREVLWPLGVALTITTAKRGEELNYAWARMSIQKVEPFEPIVGTELGEVRRTAFETWRKARTGE